MDAAWLNGQLQESANRFAFAVSQFLLIWVFCLQLFELSACKLASAFHLFSP